MIFSANHNNALFIAFLMILGNLRRFYDSNKIFMVRFQRFSYEFYFAIFKNLGFKHSVRTYNRINKNILIFFKGLI